MLLNRIAAGGSAFALLCLLASTASGQGSPWDDGGTVGTLPSPIGAPDWIRASSTYSIPVALCALLSVAALLLCHRWLLVRDEQRFPQHQGGWAGLWGGPVTLWVLIWVAFLGGFLAAIHADPVWWDEFQRHRSVFATLSMIAILLTGLPAAHALFAKGGQS